MFTASKSLFQIRLQKQQQIFAEALLLSWELMRKSTLFMIEIIEIEIFVDACTKVQTMFILTWNRTWMILVKMLGVLPIFCVMFYNVIWCPFYWHCSNCHEILLLPHLYGLNWGIIFVIFVAILYFWIHFHSKVHWLFSKCSWKNYLFIWSIEIIL